VPIEAPTGVTPAVQGDHVYFGTEAGVLFAINWKKGEVAWKFEETAGSQPMRGSPAVTSEQVIFGTRSRRVRALAPADGSWIVRRERKSRSLKRRGALRRPLR
jgi:outer membrane protein assembly factor BamB